MTTTREPLGLEPIKVLCNRRINGYASIEHEGELMDCVPALVSEVEALRAEVGRLGARVKYLTGDRGLNLPTIMTEEEKKQRYYPFRCSACGFIGPSKMLEGGEAIPEAGDYDDPTCPHCHSVEINDIEDIAPQDPKDIIAAEEKALQDYCDEMERKHQSEQESIEKARQPK